MKVRDITLIAILSASLTAGKVVLMAIPNIEIVTFLMISFTILFGIKRAFWASIVFVTTEVMMYGFGTWILGYYFIWPLLILLTHLIVKRTSSEYAFAILSGIYGLSFGLFFAIFESFFYGISYGIAYWVSGIPFDIVHGVSNFIIVLVLFKPVIKAIEKILLKWG